MLLEAKDISFRYGNGPWILKNIQLSIESGERVGLVGPSGYGKSTLAKVLAGYEKPSSGSILIDGTEMNGHNYRPVQMVCQHPEQAVNPRWKMKKILTESWNPDKQLLTDMGIEEDWLKRWPIELSGGELQRFCIARILGERSEFLICDEISTMLDVITQAQIWKVLLDRAKASGMGMLVITHNIDLARQVCNRIVKLPELNQI